MERDVLEMVWCKGVKKIRDCDGVAERASLILSGLEWLLDFALKWSRRCGSGFCRLYAEKTAEPATGATRSDVQASLF